MINNIRVSFNKCNNYWDYIKPKVKLLSQERAEKQAQKNRLRAGSRLY